MSVCASFVEQDGCTSDDGQSMVHLPDEADVAAQKIAVVVPDAPPVELDRPAGEIVEPLEQPDALYSCKPQRPCVEITRKHRKDYRRRNRLYAHGGFSTTSVPD